MRFDNLLYSKTKRKQIVKHALRFQRQHQAISDHVEQLVNILRVCFPFDVIVFAMLSVHGICGKQFHC